jgi:hypothetical protein
MADPPDTLTRTSRAISLAKDFGALLRDAMLFLFAILLLFNGPLVNRILTNAGFEEGSFGGFKWRSPLLKSDSALKDANATITDLRKQLDLATAALADAQTKLNDPVLKTSLDTLRKQSQEMSKATDAVQATVARTIDANASAIAQAEQSVGDRGGKWGVVFSGDATLDAARYEVGRVAQLNDLPNPTIFLRQGSFRSVAVVDTRPAAELALASARRRRSDAYIVTLSRWCATTVNKGDYFECSPE